MINHPLYKLTRVFFYLENGKCTRALDDRGRACHVGLFLQGELREIAARVTGSLYTVRYVWMDEHV